LERMKIGREGKRMKDKVKRDRKKRKGEE